MDRVVPLEQQQRASLLRLGLTGGLGREPIEALGTRVQALGFGQRVQLEGQVSPRQHDAGARGRRRAGGIGAALRPTQLIPRALKITGRRERPGEIAPHGQLFGHGSGACVDRERLLQRGARGRVIAAAQLELAESVQRDRGVGP